jgi:hypothetical protein
MVILASEHEASGRTLDLLVMAVDMSTMVSKMRTGKDDLGVFHALTPP